MGARKRQLHAFPGTCAALDMAPGEVMMRTAYINRPYEYGADQSKDFGPDADWDIVTDRIGGIADALGLQRAGPGG